MKTESWLRCIPIMATLTLCSCPVENQIADMLALGGDCQGFYNGLKARGFRWTHQYQPSNTWVGKLEGQQYFIDIGCDGKKVSGYSILREHLDEGDRFLETLILPKMISLFGNPIEGRDASRDAAHTPEYFLWTLADRDIYLYLDYDASTRSLGRNELVLVNIK